MKYPETDYWVIREKAKPERTYAPWRRMKSDPLFHDDWTNYYGTYDDAFKEYCIVEGQRLAGADIPESEIFHIKMAIVGEAAETPPVPKKYVLANLSRAAIVKAFGGVKKSGAAISNGNYTISTYWDGHRYLLCPTTHGTSYKIADYLGDRAIGYQVLLIQDDATLMELRLVLEDGEFPKVIDLEAL